MIPTMIPSGGFVSPTANFRPSGDTSSGDTANSSTALDFTHSDFDSMLSSIEQRAKNGDAAALDTLFNYYANQRDLKTAREWTAEREDNQYQRLVKDLQKAGISPYILSSATPAVSSAPTVSYSGSHFTSQETSKRSQSNQILSNTTDIITTVMSLVGTALIAMAMMA